MLKFYLIFSILAVLTSCKQDKKTISDTDGVGYDTSVIQFSHVYMPDSSQTPDIDSIAVFEKFDPQKHRFFIKDYERFFRKKQISELTGSIFFEVYKRDGKLNNGFSYIDKKDFPIIFQNSDVTRGNFGYDPIYYSIQKTTGHQGILVFAMDNAWRNQINYISYDLDGHLIATELLYSYGGDGGYFTEISGKFINGNTYERISLECVLDDDEYCSCDSSSAIIVIFDDGKIETSESKVYKIHRKLEI